MEQNAFFETTDDKFGLCVVGGFIEKWKTLS